MVVPGGQVGGLLLLAYAGAELLGVESAVPLQLLAAPIALQEMVLAVWLPGAAMCVLQQVTIGIVVVGQPVRGG